MEQSPSKPSEVKEVAVSSSKANKKNIDAFGAIVHFVNDLWEVFGSKNATSGLALYHRLIGRIGLSEIDNIKKVVDGFNEFLLSHENSIVNNKLENIPRGVSIKYGGSDKIQIEVQKFIYQSDPTTKEIIRQHLLTISTILNPKKEKIAQLEKRINELNIDTSTKEGKFITGIMDKAKTSMTNVSTEDPMQAMMSIFQSGIIQEMVVGLQQGVGSGEMNMQSLLGTMQSAIGSMMPPQTPQPQIEEAAPQEKKQ